MGKFWNGRNLAQRKCAKLCFGILRSEAIFLGVILSTLGMRIPIVPVHFALQGPSIQETTATIQKPYSHRKPHILQEPSFPLFFL